MPGQRYWETEQTSASRPRDVTLHLRDHDIGLTTDSGVFSKYRIDAGTHVLLAEAPPPPAEGNVLDLGAGYGPIAITMALRSPGATIWGIDINQRAIGLLEENARATGATNVVAATPEMVPAGLQFAAIYSNPPVKVGKEAMHNLLLLWLPRLLPDAHAYLVVKRNLGADSLSEWLTTQGYPTTRLGSKRGYRVLDVTRSRT